MKFIDIRVVLGIVAISAVLAVLNNFRVPEANKVTWFGGQPILEKPEILP